jgi:gentisate 1,2-dioxygenase
VADVAEPLTESPDALRQAWRKANLVPLWETGAHGAAKPVRERGHLWSWHEMQPLVFAATQLRSMEITERRVLLMINPNGNPDGGGRSTITNLLASYQILLPAESAREHRHSMSALRFVLDGNGATTLVDGKPCQMEEGDLVLTPGWMWHGHSHSGSAPIVWLDVLDGPLHAYLGTRAGEPGPPHDVPKRFADELFACANIVPDIGEDPVHSPVFRYPWKAASVAVAAAPVGKDGMRRVRYVNPLTGGSSMTLIDSTLVQIDPHVATVPFRTTSHAVCAVVEGTGSTRAGDDEFSWGPRDIFALPSGSWISHRAGDKPARIFMASDREVLRRLGLLEEAFGEPPA